MNVIQEGFNELPIKTLHEYCKLHARELRIKTGGFIKGVIRR